LKKTVIIASESPVKIEAVSIGFKKTFQGIDFSFKTVSVPSNVSDQPNSDEETLKGAENRCFNAFNMEKNSDFWIGIEGGIQKSDTETEAFAWVYIMSKNNYGKSKTATFFLPDKIRKLLDKGIELGEADDIIFGLKDSKKQNGAVGILTSNNITRTQYYADAVILALIPFINPELY
jgi:inosine/xanthosine triphosphatase